MTTTTKTKRCHSEEFQELLFKFLKEWDVTINTLDDIDSQKILKNKLNRALSTITSIQNESDNRVIKKAKNESEAGKLLLENQNRKWYKELTRVYYDLQSIMFSIDHLYELKNRKLYDNIQLRAEIVKFKIT